MAPAAPSLTSTAAPPPQHQTTYFRKLTAPFLRKSTAPSLPMTSSAPPLPFHNACTVSPHRYQRPESKIMKVGIYYLAFKWRGGCSVLTEGGRSFLSLSLVAKGFPFLFWTSLLLPKGLFFIYGSHLPKASLGTQHFMVISLI